MGGRRQRGPSEGHRAAIHALQYPHARDLCRHRPHESRATWRADQPDIRDAVDLHGLGVRQRLQYSGPNVPRHGAGRQPVPADTSRRRQPQDAVDIGRDGAARLVGDVLRHNRRLPRAALQPVSGSRGADGPRTRLLVGARHRRGGGDCSDATAVGLRVRVDRNRAAGEARREYRCSRLRPRGGVRLPAARCALRELVVAARRHLDRADVHPGSDDRGQHGRARSQHPGRDRPRRAGRPCGEKRDPHRRVCKAGRGGGQIAL